MFDELVAFFTCVGLVLIWSCYLYFCLFVYYRHEDVDSLIEDAYDDNDQTFEMEIIGNPNVEVMIDFIILTLHR